jgi:hypothetical protein
VTCEAMRYEPLPQTICLETADGEELLVGSHKRGTRRAREATWKLSASFNEVSMFISVLVSEI